MVVGKLVPLKGGRSVAFLTNPQTKARTISGIYISGIYILPIGGSKYATYRSHLLGEPVSQPLRLYGKIPPKHASREKNPEASRWKNVVYVTGLRDSFEEHEHPEMSYVISTNGGFLVLCCWF